MPAEQACWLRGTKSWCHGPLLLSSCIVPLPGLNKDSECHIYRTGDLATAGPNGYIQVVDRKKDMLLVGGENVYSE